MKEVEERDDNELESLREQLRRLSGLLRAQRAARARVEVDVVAWEAKVEALRAGGGGAA